MRQFLDRASMSFAAGAFGALINSLAIWAAGAHHLTARLGVRIAPHLAADWLYPRIVWGGLWGFLFMLPLVRGHWWLRGIILSLGPSAFQMLYVFPRETGEGYFGLPRHADSGIRAGSQRRLGILCGVAAAHDRPGMILHERAGRFFSRRATRKVLMNDAASEVRSQVSEAEWDLRADLAAC